MRLFGLSVSGSVLFLNRFYRLFSYHPMTSCFCVAKNNIIIYVYKNIILLLYLLYKMACFVDFSGTNKSDLC